MDNKVYVYKCYNDEYAYGEEFLRVFSNKADAIAELKKDVSEHFEMPFEDIPNNEDIFDEDADHFAEDYVSIQEGDHVLFWIVEEQSVIRSEEPCAVVVSYSFDTEKSVHLFDTYKEACAFIKQDSYHELLIDTDENGHVEGKDEFYSFEKAEDGYSSATLTVINSVGDKDITEWTISDIKTK